MTDPIRAALERLHHYAEIHPEHDTDSIIADARAALAQPTLPTDGEVEKLVVELNRIADNADFTGQFTDADHISRAAELLQQRHPTPVPVSERPWEREGWCDESGRCWWGRKADELCNSDWHYSTWAEVQEFCSDAMPQVTLPAHALPLPAEHNQS